MGSKYNHKMGIFTKEEIDLLIKNARTREFRDLIIVLRESGCRIKEVLDLQAGDITFQEGVAILKVNGKTGVRMVPVLDHEGVIGSLVRNKKNEDRLFKHPYVTQYFRLKWLMSKLGMRKSVSFHGIRHYAATTYLRNGMPEQVVKKMFGWTPDSAMLKIYSHMCVDDVVEHVKRIHRCKRSLVGPFMIEMYN